MAAVAPRSTRRCSCPGRMEAAAGVGDATDAAVAEVAAAAAEAVVAELGSSCFADVAVALHLTGENFGIEIAALALAIDHADVVEDVVAAVAVAEILAVAEVTEVGWPSTCSSPDRILWRTSV